MLIWLGSIEFETPRGRFILTGAPEIRGVRRRPATKEEAAEAWRFFESWLWTAPWHALRPVFELYYELTAEPLNGLSGEPHLSLVLHAIDRALWSKQLHFVIQLPFDPLPVIDWEPPPVKDLVKRVASQSPSEIWGKKNAPKPDVHFTVLFVDETQQSIANVPVMFTHGDETQSDTSNGSGKVEYSTTGDSSASVIVESTDKLEEELIERWKQLRTPKLLDGADITRLALYDAEKTSATLTHAKPHTIQIVPELACLYLELVDKSGRIRLDNCPYAIAGPEPLSGTTDENAILRHDDVFPGNYTLTLVRDGRTYTTEVVAQPVGTSDTQVRKLAVVPRSIMASLRGFVFEKNKAFLMPAAIESLQEIRDFFFRTAPNEILIVGHADTTADAKTNDPLSLSRADCAKALMLGDVNAWLGMYTTTVGDKHRWGSREDGMMIGAMPDYAAKPPSEGPVYWYQRTRGLKQDGDCGTKTRTKLIEEYMALVGEPLAKDPEFTSPMTTHGCGENFPLDETGENLDPNPPNPKDDKNDRRVEFFFFDAEYGIQPPATTKNSKPKSTEYPKWREGAEPKFDFDTPEAGMRVLRLRLHNRILVPIDQQSEGGADPSTQEVPYRVTIGTVQRPEKKAPAGKARVVVPETCLEPIVVEWGELDANGNYPFERRIFADCRAGTARQKAHARLSNLGYRFKVADDGEFALAAQQFQKDYGITEERGLVKKRLGTKTKQVLNQIYATGVATPPIFQSQPNDTNAGAKEDPIAPFADSDPPVPDLRMQATGFVDGGAIDPKHAGGSYGSNTTPELKWDAGPANTQAFAVFMYDPAADCVHWLVADIPGTAKGLNKTSGGTACQNYLNQTYAGPNPPKGEVHMYVLRVVALDKAGLIPTNRAIERSEFDTLIQGHLLADSYVASQFPAPS